MNTLRDEASCMCCNMLENRHLTDTILVVLQDSHAGQYFSEFLSNTALILYSSFTALS